MDQALSPSDLTAPRELDRIEALATAATDGPWTPVTRTYTSDVGTYQGSFIAGVCEEASDEMGVWAPLSPEDAEFIVAARTYVPASAAELRLLRLQLKTAKDTIDRVEALSRVHEREWADRFDADKKERAALQFENDLLKSQVARNYFDFPVTPDAVGE